MHLPSASFSATGAALHLPRWPHLPLFEPLDHDHCGYCRTVHNFMALWEGGSPEGSVSSASRRAAFEFLGRQLPGSLAAIDEISALGVAQLDLAQMGALLVVLVACQANDGEPCRVYAPTDDDFDQLLDG